MCSQYRMYPDMTENEIYEVLKTKKFIVNSTHISVKYWFEQYHDRTGEIWNAMVDLAKASGITEETIKIWEDSDTFSIETY